MWGHLHRQEPWCDPDPLLHQAETATSLGQGKHNSLKHKVSSYQKRQSQAVIGKHIEKAASRWQCASLRAHHPAQEPTSLCKGCLHQHRTQQVCCVNKSMLWQHSSKSRTQETPKQKSPFFSGTKWTYFLKPYLYLILYTLCEKYQFYYFVCISLM